MIKIVDAALTSGVTEKRTIEYTFTGKVIVSGPLVKKVMTKSSRLSVKASKAPATKDGFICGSRTSRNACHSVAPRSLAASSSSLLKLANRARTTIATKGKQKVIWAIVIAERFSGQAKSVGQSSLAKKIKNATPKQISGTIIGNDIVPSTSPLNGKRKRQSMTAAKAPITKLMMVAKNAMVSELTIASTRLSLFSAFS